MKNNKLHIEELIRKKLLGQISPEEALLLEQEKAYHSEESYDNMVIEVLRGLGGQLPKGKLGDWRPDMDMVIEKAEAIQVGMEMVTALKRDKRRKLLGRIAFGVSACLVAALLFVLAGRESKPPQLYVEGSCGDAGTDIELPLSESVSTLMWGDDNRRVLTAGESVAIGPLVARRMPDGLLVLEENAAVEMDYKLRELVISTAALQQCVVQLPNGAHVRLNAQSALHYPLQQLKNRTAVRVSGEALITMEQKRGVWPLRLVTDNGQVTMEEGEVMVMALNGMTQATILKGVATLQENNKDRGVKLDCLGAQGLLVRIADRDSRNIRDTLFYTANADYDKVKRWSKAVRVYEDASLRDFVVEMSRWYGFRIQNIHCIPDERRVNESVCHRLTEKEIFAIIRQNGTKMVKRNELLSFCPEDTDTRLAKKP
ncbi:FecR family protein [Sphingobacterium paucimobilis]|uniref:FecR protein domain-containing protein n=1 Tax=Sphingobacterium paucimobilis HER1398 TaxID=1346330 RepID=U2JER5_9SPHI|nr:FecR family protein [Sphingobacterium paucimobilis]ERJ61153.1 hypothetical protein M472_20590 [Sphingobacterium paucimobilis HER1398]